MKKSLDNRIIRLIHRRDNEMTETSKLTELLDTPHLRFKDPISLDTIKRIKYLDIMEESSRILRSGKVATDLSNRLHAVPSAIISTDDYV